MVETCSVSTNWQSHARAQPPKGLSAGGLVKFLSVRSGELADLRVHAATGEGQGGSYPSALVRLLRQPKINAGRRAPGKLFVFGKYTAGLADDGIGHGRLALGRGMKRP